MRQFTLSTGSYLGVEVPGIAMSGSLFCNMGYLVYKAWDETNMITDKDIEKDFFRVMRTGKSKYENATIGDSLMPLAVKLPDGDWKIIGEDPLEISEIEAAQIVDSIEYRGKWRYKDYEQPPCEFYTALESYQSLLTSLGLKEPVVILKKK